MSYHEFLFSLVVEGAKKAFNWLKKNKQMSFSEVQKKAKILFIDDGDCEIVKTLQKNDLDVKKIDDVKIPARDKDVQWANLIFVDYKGVGKELFDKKEGLGLIVELEKIYGDKKRYVIYSSKQDFDGVLEFSYIRKNGSYDEFTALICSEISKL